MEIRYFQILIPLLALFLIIRQIRECVKSISSINETILIVGFWICVMVFALFPDFVSTLVANIFGIKDNINAILFFSIGLIFYFQFRLYKMQRKQDELLTEITRKIALDQEKESNL